MTENTKDSAVEPLEAPEAEPKLSVEQQAWLVRRNAKIVKSIYLNVASILILLASLGAAFFTQKAYFRGELNNYSTWAQVMVIASVVVLVTVVTVFLLRLREDRKLGKFPAGEVNAEPLPPAKIGAPSILISLVDMALIVTWGIFSFSW